MAFNGSGTYVLPVNSLSPDATAGTTIVSDDFDELTASLETALTLCFPHDGQRTATGNFKMGSNKITGLADGAALADAPSINQIVDGALLHCATPSAIGTDAYVVALAVSPGTLVTGARYSFTPDVDNTGACTINFNSIGVKNIKLVDGTDPHNGAIQANAPALLQYDGTNFVLMNPNPTLTPSVTTLTVSGAATFNGAVTLGNAAGDAITVTGTATFAENVQINAAVTATGLATVGEITCTAANPEILGGDTNGITYISAGATKDLGGNILLYGDTHANGGDIIFRDDTTTELAFDASGSSWDFQANAITTTGALTCGTFTSTGLNSFSGDCTISAVTPEFRFNDTTGATAGGGDNWSIKVDADTFNILQDTDAGSDWGGTTAAIFTVNGGQKSADPEDVFFRNSSSGVTLHYDFSQTEWDFKANNILTTGAITGGSATVDDVAINGKVITMTGSAGDTAVFTAGTNGTLSIVTTDAAAAAANIQITADGTVDIDSAGNLTLDSGAGILLEPAAGSVITLDGTITIDAGVVAGITDLGTVGTADIDGGTADNVVIGGSTAAAITGTTIKANTSLELATGAICTGINDTDTMSDASATTIATSESIKAYVDNLIDNLNSIETVAASSSTIESTAVPSTAIRIEIMIDNVSSSLSNGQLDLEIGSSTYSGAGAIGCSVHLLNGDTTVDSDPFASGKAKVGEGTQDNYVGLITLVKHNDNTWTVSFNVSVDGSNDVEVHTGSGQFTASGTVDRWRLTHTTATLTGNAHARYYS